MINFKRGIPPGDNISSIHVSKYSFLSAPTPIHIKKGKLYFRKSNIILTNIRKLISSVSLLPIFSCYCLIWEASCITVKLKLFIKAERARPVFPILFNLFNCKFKCTTFFCSVQLLRLHIIKKNWVEKKLKLHKSVLVLR